MTLPEKRFNSNAGGEPRPNWAEESGLQQGQVAGADVRMEFVLAGAGFLERAKQAAVGFTKRRSRHVSRVDRGVHMRILLRIADVDGEVARVKLDVLVSGDALDTNVTSRDTQIQIAIFGQVDGDLNVV